MEALVQEFVANMQQLLQNPLAVPVLGSLAALLLTIVALYSLASATSKKKGKPQGGTIITEQGVRRSTRQHKQPPKYTPEKFEASPAAAKTPRTAKTPKTTKKEDPEAETVTPKATKPRTTRAAAKTPATVEPMTTRTRRGSAKTPAK